jgi:hypothetical protein
MQDFREFIRIGQIPETRRDIGKELLTRREHDMLTSNVPLSWTLGESWRTRFAGFGSGFAPQILVVHENYVKILRTMWLPPERRMNRTEMMKTTERRAYQLEVDEDEDREANSDSDDVVEGSNKDDVEPKE